MNVFCCNVRFILCFLLAGNPKKLIISGIDLNRPLRPIVDITVNKSPVSKTLTQIILSSLKETLMSNQTFTLETAQNSTQIEQNSTQIEQNSTQVEQNSSLIEQNSSLIEQNSPQIDKNSSSRKTETTTNKATEIKPTESEIKKKYEVKIKGLLSAKATYGVMKDMQYIKLANGQIMPVLFLGTALMDPVLLPYIIGAAIDLGFRAIDTAYIYGNEREIGDAIHAKIEDGTVKRKDLFIIGKLWSTFHQRDLVEGACAKSLKNLRLDYFDLYLVHNPMSLKEGGDAIPMVHNVLQYSEFDYLDAWYGMEQLVTKGLTKSIGVSNFNSVQVARVIEDGKIKPVVNQVECHPYLNQQRLHDFCAERNVRLMCYGVLGSKGTPQEFKASNTSVIDDPVVKFLAADLKVSPAKLLLNFQFRSGHAAIVKASSAAHLWDALQAIHLKMRDKDYIALHALNNNHRTYIFKGMGDTHKNYPLNIPF